MFITADYFKVDIYIPAVEKTSAGSVNGDTSKLGSFIEEYEARALEEILGAKMVKDLTANVKDKTVISTSDQKWKDLVNGVDYKVGTTDYTWRGLLFTRGTLKKSLLAYYVYFHFIQDIAMVNDSFVRAKQENFNHVDPISKIRSSWREFYNLVVGESYSPTVNITSNSVSVDYFGSKGGERSLNQYLTDKKADFLNWKPTQIEPYDVL